MHRSDTRINPTTCRSGKVLEEFIEARDLSARELAAAGGSCKLVVEIIAGKAPIEPKRYARLERCFGNGRIRWLNMEGRVSAASGAGGKSKTFEKMRSIVVRFRSQNLLSAALFDRQPTRPTARVSFCAFLARQLRCFFRRNAPPNFRPFHFGIRNIPK